jgi:uncharacterized membrane protein YkvA (DUF1232 family)
MIQKLLFFLRPGFLRNLLFHARLILRLMLDRRVSFFLKLIPLASLAYMVLPDFIPFPIDDVVVVGLGMSWFLKLCPRPVVEEHSSRLNRGVAA